LLESFVQTIAQDLEMEGAPKQEDKNTFLLQLTDKMTISLRELDERITLSSRIGECPLERREELFIHLMKANFLGQGTGGATIGLDEEEKFLTLSSVLPYEMNYKTFKDALEDFANYLDYWREELIRHIQRS
jgi:Tir chaperone protein (CesT) family